MTKARSVALILCIAVVLTMVLVPSAGAAPDRISASGVWSWYGGEFVPGQIVEGNQLFTGWENGIWAGTFEGTAYEPFRGVIFPSGAMWALITINFTGFVNGRYGAAVMQLTVNAPPEETMGGRWVVVSGAGKLAHLRGNGTWVFTGSSSDDVYGYADYTGTLRLD